jgi:tetratricopeptide (TPR) repeat protein
MAAVLGATPVAEAVERCIEDLRELPPNSTAAARARAALAGVTAMTGRFDEAREHLALARATLEEFGLKLRAVALHYLAGFIDLLAGRPADAEEQLRRGREECERMGERYVLANLLALLAQATYLQGRYGEAVTLAEAGEDVAPADEVVAHVTAYGARAKALARLGNEAEARVLAGDAVAAVENTGLLNVRADGLLDLAEVLEVVGETEPAMAAATDALALYERKGNVVSAGRATTVLERLRG